MFEEYEILYNRLKGYDVNSLGHSLVDQLRALKRLNKPNDKKNRHYGHKVSSLGQYIINDVQMIQRRI